MKKIIQTAGLFLLISLCSCKKNVNSPGGTSAEKMANEWWVTLKIGNQDLLGTHVAFSTYNTSDNKDSIWLDDLENGYDFKCKAAADFNNLTFSTKNTQNQYYDIRVDISNGKIFPNGGISKAGNVTDSIYFEAKFSDDPDNTYIISGTARTRFPEDDY